MATSLTQTISPLVAAVDLSDKANQGKLIEITASNTGNVSNAAGELCVGALVNNPKLGQAIELAIGPIVEVICGGTIAFNSKLSGTAAGKVLTAVATNHVHGIALEAGVLDQKIRMLWNPTGILA